MLTHMGHIYNTFKLVKKVFLVLREEKRVELLWFIIMMMVWDHFLFLIMGGTILFWSRDCHTLIHLMGPSARGAASGAPIACLVIVRHIEWSVIGDASRATIEMQ